MSLFGTSGIRRIADRALIELALRVGLAVGSIYHRVVVGTDTRTSSPLLKHALIAGLLAGGAECRDAGVVPTPALALAVRDFAAGVMITASHNTPEYNGLKLWNPDGSAFDTEQRQQIEAMISENSLKTATWDGFQECRIYPDAIERHIARILADFPGKLKLKVVVDCACGAASVITPYLLTKLGCDVVALNAYPSGFFPHPVEPVESNLGDLIRVVGELGADLGLAHDGDADRLMAVDDKGRFITGDKLLALFARDLAARKVVTTVDASMVVDEMGITVVRTRVGDSFVSEEISKGGDFGGEPSGAWIFPKISLCPDGIYAAARLAAIASRSRLSRLVDDIPSYPIRRGSLDSAGVVMSKVESQLLALKPESVGHTDGLKLGFSDGWLLIRPSGTEPKIRLTVEAKSETRVAELYNSGMQAIRNAAKEK